MRLVIATCEVDYSGKPTAHLPDAKRLVMVKSDGSVSIHSDGGAYKPLNWMAAPCSMVVEIHDNPDIQQTWTVKNSSGDHLRIILHEIESDTLVDLGVDPGLEKDGVERHLQEMLSASVTYLRADLELVRREYPTAIGPIDLLCRTSTGGHVGVEIKRRGEIDSVEQLSRYLELLRRDPLLGTVEGMLVAQVIKPQARVLAKDRGIECVLIDYDELRGIEPAENRLF
jgi:RecB family endonuclease NucS